jgi:hypothetical protein
MGRNNCGIIGGIILKIGILNNNNISRYLRKAVAQRRALALNKITDSILRKAATGADITEYKKDGIKAISNGQYIIEQYFKLSHKFNKACRARLPKLIKNTEVQFYSKPL